MSNNPLGKHGYAHFKNTQNRMHALTYPHRHRHHHCQHHCWSPRDTSLPLRTIRRYKAIAVTVCLGIGYAWTRQRSLHPPFENIIYSFTLQKKHASTLVLSTCQHRCHHHARIYRHGHRNYHCPRRCVGPRDS